MTQHEFVQKWKHEWRGMLLDTAFHSSREAMRSLELKALETKIDKHLAQMFADAQPGESSSTAGSSNGTSATPRSATPSPGGAASTAPRR